MVRGRTLPVIPLRGVKRRWHSLKHVGPRLERIGDVQQFVIGNFDLHRVTSSKSFRCVTIGRFSPLGDRVDRNEPALSRPAVRSIVTEVEYGLDEIEALSHSLP
jgi:hypothetical protein